MNKRISAIIFLILAAAGASFAQTVEQRVEQIRRLYKQTNERIDAGFEDKSAGFHHAAITIGGEKDAQQWRAVGNRDQTTEFYFDCEPDDPECATDTRRLVVKIAGTYQAGSSITSSFEYLFNDKGELVFAFTTEADDENKPFESRLYFAAGKLIRVTRGGKNTDARFAAADLEKAGAEIAEAKRLQNLFALMFGE